MKRVTETNFTTRVYQYGAVPIDMFPDEGSSELFRANRLWNNLVDLHRKSGEKYYQALSEVDEEYASLRNAELKLKEKLQKAREAKQTARMKARTTDASHPLIKEANKKINALYSELKEVWASKKKGAPDNGTPVCTPYIFTTLPARR